MRTQVSILSALLVAAAGALAGVAEAASPVGQVTHLSGTLIAKRADGSTKLFSTKSEVQEGDTLATEQETYARIKFADGGEVVLRPGSQLKVAAYAYDQAKPASDNIVLNMLKGGLRAVTGLVGKRNRDAVNFATTTATIGIRGTHFGALICQNDCGGVPTVTGKPPENGLHLDVADGAIVVKNAAGQQVISSGQFGFVQSATTPPVIVPPAQGIQVTMPTSISQNSSSGRGVGKAKEGECAVQ
ncbi:MAG: FecR domain-containing protein [Betaproteobacteria bacterium]|nr:FecR domain-containing protein [Betaproteobacteria bacterium]